MTSTDTPLLAHDIETLVSSKSDLCFDALIAVLHVIPCYIRPRYNGTRLYHYRSVLCNKDLTLLTHLPLVSHKCVNELGQHRFR